MDCKEKKNNVIKQLIYYNSNTIFNYKTGLLKKLLNMF